MPPKRNPLNPNTDSTDRLRPKLRDGQRYIEIEDPTKKEKLLEKNL